MLCLRPQPARCVLLVKRCARFLLCWVREGGASTTAAQYYWRSALIHMQFMQMQLPEARGLLLQHGTGTNKHVQPRPLSLFSLSLSLYSLASKQISAVL